MKTYDLWVSGWKVGRQSQAIRLVATFLGMDILDAVQLTAHPPVKVLRGVPKWMAEAWVGYMEEPHANALNLTCTESDLNDQHRSNMVALRYVTILTAMSETNPRRRDTLRHFAGILTREIRAVTPPDPDEVQRTDCKEPPDDFDPLSQLFSRLGFTVVTVDEKGVRLHKGRQEEGQEDPSNEPPTPG